MANHQYRAGEDLARAAKSHLEDNGYYVCKAGGSKGIADLVAVKSGEVLLIQCKTKGAISPADREKLVSEAIARQPPCLCCRVIPLICIWLKDGRAARRPVYAELTGTGIGQRHEWTPDYGFERTST